MSLLTWYDGLSVNIKMIDDQHKRLVDMLNEVHSAIEVSKGQNVIGPVLQNLISYTLIHFAAEEGLMLTYNYPDYLKHKVEHEHLTRQVHELMGKYKSGDTAITDDLIKLLKKWIAIHIVETDKQYSPFLNDKGVV